MSDATVTSEADAVNKAASWAEALLAKVHHGPGDNIETAMYRAEASFGILRLRFGRSDIGSRSRWPSQPGTTSKASTRLNARRRRPDFVMNWKLPKPFRLPRLVSLLLMRRKLRSDAKKARLERSAETTSKPEKSE